MSQEPSFITGFDHLQVTAPRDREAEARAFYGEVLGLVEIPKPAVLAARGGAWYQCGDLQLHLGLQDDLTPQRKAHPAFRVRDLEAMRARLAAAGVPITTDEQIPGYERFETRDPFGNRLEFMRRLGDPGAEAHPDDAAESIKRQVRAVFGAAAQAYVTSPGHAAGDDLTRLVQLAAPQPDDRALDVSTGGGHTALAVAPHVAHVTASDLTPAMLAAARAHLTARGAGNVDYVVADAEHLPFLDASFDLVTVRIAPHHYADVQAAVREMARVLVPGGRLVLIDNIVPEDAALDALANDWEKRRDPSHVRAYTSTQWRAFVGEAGLQVTDLEVSRKAHDFQPWVARTGMTDADAHALEADMLAAPAPAREHFAIEERDGRLERWSSDFVLLRAVK
jgi:ubiquinone/menaquinone biosynthesis C-methylase UbiE/catechol 2,3-dioxygenase-like lactoylglutathione lyase family enzyme